MSHRNIRIDSLQANNIISKIDSLLDRASYFEARKLISVNKEHIDTLDKLRFNANIYSVFNRPKISNENISILFKDYENEMSKTTKKDLLLIELSNSVKLYEYGKVNEISNLLITDYKDVISENELFGIKNNNIIWEAVKNVPKQEIEFKDDSKLKITRNSIGLKTIELKSENKSHPFIFDTGANISTVTQTQAEALNLKIIDVKVSVSTITGKRVDSKVGIASELSIGNMVFKNVIFLVFPDEALYIPQVNFQLNGILGFPVIEAMKEIHFMKNDELYIPVSRNNNYNSNLAIAYLTPIINLRDSVGEMHFSFDTGASTTSLYISYYEKYKSKIDSSYSKTKISFAGAGGGTEVEGYNIDFSPIINGENTHLPYVALYTDKGKANNLNYYGNIGQDLISKFDKMILNFDKMYIHFE